MKRKSRDGLQPLVEKVNPFHQISKSARGLSSAFQPFWSYSEPPYPQPVRTVLRAG
ncbi:MAG: hypothetical protein HC892_22645 [Saprospiraceae bacterium]|nr:hypothetical protein [Saprospiraceae bacterium]